DRSITPKARLIPLTAPFLTYLRSDGILLPPEPQDLSSTETDSGIYSAPSSPSSTFSNSSNNKDDDDDDDDTPPDPSLAWPDIHAKITATIAELGGNVCPKLNWSAPKDATWINATNSMECRSANDVYLLLKSSDFITHDLEQAFDGCVDNSPPVKSPKRQILVEGNQNENENENEKDEKEKAQEQQDKRREEEVPYTLTLRKTIPSFLPSCEFRCFVRARALLCVSQRDLNFYDFLPPLVHTVLRPLIQTFFDEKLKESFEEDNFVFDVYVPPPHGRVWLVDINPWAGRTDPLLFGWMEVLGMPARCSDRGGNGSRGGGGGGEGEGQGQGGRQTVIASARASEIVARQEQDTASSSSSSSSSSSKEETDISTPEFRLVGRNDPEAYSFNTPQYSAHKLPKDVVDASGDGEAGLREFMGRWREIVKEQEEER
ncbi:MAG: hypothetical protein Q9216_007219, partial [Gyalolechia sp. 2 TL-2023]